jgi:pyrroloquinoline quinone biosynthesis protein B
MKVRVLGSAAGGGFPQWNCGCEHCLLARQGSSRVRPRSQDSVAISADGERWFLLNASPDVHAQIARTPALHPRRSRHSPIAGVVLTNGDLDHTLGLFSLRESQPLALYATAHVHGGLDHDAMLRTLQRFPGQLKRHALELDREISLVGPDDEPSGLTVVARGVAGKPPVHLMGTLAPSVEDNVALFIRSAGGRTLAYASTVAALDEALLAALAASDVVLFDGTFWSSDELSARGLGTARAEDMAHQPVGGPRGSLARLGALSGPRRIYTHINNSNPLLLEDSAERAAVLTAGVEIAVDGLELEV